MKSLLLFLFALIFSSFSWCQEEVETRPAALTYAAEIPTENSYQIVKNTSNQELTNQILLQINAHRKHNEDFLWVVNEELEILIFKF